MATFDDVLRDAGTCGRCQRRVFALLSLLSMSCACVYASVVFQGFTPEHRCRDAAAAERARACGWGPADARRRMLLPPVNSSGETRRSSCQQYELDWNATELTCDAQHLDLRGAPVIPCKDGWEYQDDGQKSLVSEFDLVCSDGWLVDVYQSSLMVGFLLSSCVCGVFADRFGRSPSLLLCNALVVSSGILLAVVPNYTLILLLRTVYGFGAKGGWMTSFVLITELVGAEHRRTVGNLYQMFFSVGLLVLPLFAYLIRDWRWLQAFITAPYIFFLLFFWFVPESPRWLISQNNSSKARGVMEALAKENKKKLSETFETLTGDAGDAPSASLLDLVRTPNMRKHTIILMFNWFSCAVVYQGLIMRVGLVGGNIYINFLISSLFELPAVFLIIFTIERFGRRLPFAASNIVTAASCIITAFIPDSMFWFKMVVGCVGRLGVTMAFELVVFVNTELYPTFVRNQGLSICSTLCDFGGVVAPMLLYRLAAVWLELPLIIFGAAAFTAGCLVLLLPETRGVPLPETIDDIEFPDRRKDNPPENRHTRELLKQKDLTNNKEPTSV